MKTAATLTKEIREKAEAAASMNGGGKDFIEDYADSIISNVAILSALEQRGIERELKKAGFGAVALRSYMATVRKTGRDIATQAKEKEKEARELELGPADTRKPSEKAADALEEGNFHLRTNTLDDRVEVNGEPLTDGLEAIIYSHMRDLGWGDPLSGLPSIAAFKDFMRAIATKETYNPLQEWFEGLPEWDGRKHFENLCSYVECKQKFTGSDGTERFVFDAFLWRSLLGIVARAFYTPMCQPPMLVLHGPQGIGKSTLVEKLTPCGREFFVSQPIHPDNKDHLRQLMNISVWEVGELGATTRKADVESLKQFLTTPVVTVRHPYDKHNTVKPPITVFFGTINPGAGFLNDESGDRRFAVVEIQGINHAYATEVDMTQVWAQVYHHWKKDHDSWKYTEEEWATRSTNNKKHRAEQRYTSDIPRLFKIDAEKRNDRDWWLPTGMIRDHMEANRIKCNTAADENQLGTALRLLGTEKKQRSFNGTPTWGYQGIQPRDLTESSLPTIGDEVES